MTMAFILINGEIAAEEDVLRELRKIEQVKEAYVVYGVYDIIVRVEAKDMEELRSIVTQRIRRIDDVRTTLTMVVAEGSQGQKAS
ncbi:TPA: Lrp/AsnC family transcriptional regulator [Candidatus Bathyarchaeota archaeon]|nr:Lrp/AsnC family transcriptional regulator [Candidatus Bathyarchaeota archaeon]